MLSDTACKLLHHINYSIALSQRYAEYGVAGVKEHAAIMDLGNWRRSGILRGKGAYLKKA